MAVLDFFTRNFKPFSGIFPENGDPKGRHVLYWSDMEVLPRQDMFYRITKMFPRSMACSSSGQICHYTANSLRTSKIGPCHTNKISSGQNIYLSSEYKSVKAEENFMLHYRSGFRSNILFSHSCIELRLRPHVIILH